MKISVISRWRDEAFFAPFFLNHYSLFADEIIIKLDNHTTDNTLSVLKNYPKVRYEFFESWGRIDNNLYANMMSQLAWYLDSDWVFYVDADELIFPFDSIWLNYDSVRFTLSHVKPEENIIIANLNWVYKHNSEHPLNPNNLPLPQRRHGASYKLAKGYYENQAIVMRKPSIVRPSAKVQWMAGQHDYVKAPHLVESSIEFNGAHWQMADVENAIHRTIPRSQECNRSETDKINGWGQRNLTEEDIRKECESHLNDPQII